MFPLFPVAQIMYYCSQSTDQPDKGLKTETERRKSFFGVFLFLVLGSKISLLGVPGTQKT